MIGHVRTMCRLVLCLIFMTALIPVCEAKAKLPKIFERSKAKTAAKRSAAKEHKEKKAFLKAMSSKLALAPSHRQPSIRPSRVSMTEPLAGMELPEEVVTAELSGEAQPLDDAALQMIGARYRFGGNSTSGIDCSAFVQRVYSLLKIHLPRTAREQFNIGTEIAPHEVRKGDLVFFHTYASYASHVGIYLGDGRMIHASSGSHRVVISSMDTPYYRSRYLGARRLPGKGEEPLPQLLAAL